MQRSLLVAVALWVLVLPATGRAEAVRLALFPFSFHGKEDLRGLQGPLRRILTKGLRQQGFRPLAVEEAELPPGELTDERVRQVGAKLGAAFCLYGSLSKIGEKLSLDVRLVEVSGRRPTAVLYVTRTGLENLAGAGDELVREVAIRVYQKKKINRIIIRGNQRIEDEAIKLVIKSKSGDLFEPARLRDDLKAIYRMGYFKDVRVEAEDTPKGQDVIFTVSEKPTVSKVVIRGADAIDEKDIRAAISTRAFSIFRQAKLAADIEKIKALYRNKGYYNAEIATEVREEPSNRVVVVFKIEEHDKLYIRSITFSGNHAFSDAELKDVIKTSEKGFFFWLTESGILKMDKLEVDVDRLAAFYHNNGFIDAKVGSPIISHDQEGISIEFPISEGQRYRIGKVEVGGEGVEPDPALLATLALGKEEYFNREVLVRDLQRVTDYFTAKGYAFAEVSPRIHKDEANKVVDITYEVRKGELVDITRIEISGNSKTRDKVIRRELQVVEGDRYDKAKLERSVQNLRRLDYFEQVELDTTRGESPEKMHLTVKVKEKPTSFVSLGGGYSSADKAFLAAQIAERNLGGRGQRLSFNGQMSGVSSRFSLSFTEPWLFDIPLSTTVELYDWVRDYDEFTKDSTGGRLGFGYPVWDYTRIYLSYAYDDATVSDVADDAALVIKQQEGNIISSTMTATLRRDSRDHFFLTTKGSDNSIMVEYAGGVLGGDAGYTKTVLNSNWYFPLWGKFVGFLHGKMGFIGGSGDGFVPIYERFYLGGINSIRAFASGDVSPRDPASGDRIGGNKMALFNAELLFPLAEAQGVRGVVFYDAGNAFDNGEGIDLSDFRTGVGGGLRWYSPMGPLRLEWGYNLDPKPGESRSRWQFSLGIFF